MKARPSAEKRRKERDRQERQQEKAARREQRKAERAQRGETGAPGVDPDIAHIVAGPHNRPVGASAVPDDDREVDRKRDERRDGTGRSADADAASGADDREP